MADFDGNYTAKEFQRIRREQEKLAAQFKANQPPESAELQARRKLLEENLKSDKGKQRTLPPRTNIAPNAKTDTGWEDIKKAEREAARRKSNALTAERLGLEKGNTNQPRAKGGVAVGTRPGAEIPHLAVGAAAVGAGLSSKEFRMLAGGSAVFGGISAGINFAAQLASGEDPIKAAFLAGGSGLGYVAGTVLGAAGVGLLTVNPLAGLAGGFAGGALGGLAGRQLGSSLYDLIFGKSRQAQVVKPKPKGEAPPFTGGQSNIGYALVFEAPFQSPSTGLRETTIVTTPHPSQGLISGPIEKMEFIPELYLGSIWQWEIIVTHNGGQKRGLAPVSQRDSIENPQYKPTFLRFETFGVADTGGNLPGTTPAPGTTQISIAQSRPQSTPPNYLPGGSKYPNRNPAPPLADKPAESNKRTPLKITVPAGKAVTLTTPDGNSVTVAPSPQPRTITIPRPLLPQLAPGQLEPDYDLAPVVISVASPTGVPILLTAPGVGATTISIPGQQPYTFNPASSIGSPLPLSTIRPIGGREPVTLPPLLFAPSPTTTPTIPATPPSTTTPATPADLENLLLPLGIVGGLAGLGFLIKQIHDRTSPQEIGKAAEAATCRTTQPGGCSSNLANNTGDRKNQELLEKLGAGTAQGAELGILNVMNNKLGAQMPGGLSAGFGRLSNFLGVDRIFNLLNFLVLLHNASMLTSSLKVTLLEMLSSIGNATGLLQSAEGDNIDLNAVFNQGVEGFVVQLIGAEAWASAKLTWRKYSPIYRAASNSLSAIGNMFSSIGNGIEVIGERSGKIGNALRAAGVVRENAYNFMSENMNVHTNKFMTFQNTIAGATQVLEVINEVAENVVEGQEGYTEAVKATDAFKKTLAEADKNSEKKDADNLAVKAEAEKIKANLVKDPTGEDEQGLLSFLTDL